MKDNDKELSAEERALRAMDNEPIKTPEEEQGLLDLENAAKTNPNYGEITNAIITVAT